MSRKKQALTKAGQPRKRKPGAGRPSLGKVKMTVHILPATRQALGDKPGEVLDAHFGGANRITQINQSLAPKAFAVIAERIASSINGTAVFKGLAYEGTVGGEIWHIGFGKQTFVNTWTDASFGL